MLSHDPKVRALHVSIVSLPYGGSSVIRKRATCKARALISWVIEFSQYAGEEPGETQRI
jgi:hypothetical protein